MLGQQKIKTSNLKSILTTVTAVLAIGGLIFILVSINNSKEKTIAITRAKTDIYPNFLIEAQFLEKYEIAYREYTESGNKYLLWEEHDQALNKYASVFTKKGLYLIKDDYNDSRPIKNEWLLDIDENSLIVSIPYNKNEAFGNILTPGDHIKVNINYITQKTDPSGFSGGTEVKGETLFEDAQVLDMLNGSGNSIYDYYMDLLALPLAQRTELLRDDSFLNNVSPTDILIQVEKQEEFDYYTKIQNFSSLKYIYGLYKRLENDTVLDQFRDLTRQITTSQTQSTTTEGGDTQ